MAVDGFVRAWIEWVLQLPLWGFVAYDTITSGVNAAILLCLYRVVSRSSEKASRPHRNHYLPFVALWILLFVLQTIGLAITRIRVFGAP